MTNYYVIPFTYQQQEENLEFMRKAGQAIEATQIALAQHPERMRQAVIVEAMFYEAVLAQISMTGFPNIPEYDEWLCVYFVNEAAMRMYGDIGLSVNILKIIPKEEVPEGLGWQYRMPYLPNS